jgi:hypothetical protein
VPKNTRTLLPRCACFNHQVPKTTNTVSVPQFASRREAAAGNTNQQTLNSSKQPTTEIINKTSMIPGSRLARPCVLQRWHAPTQRGGTALESVLPFGCN